MNHMCVCVLKIPKKEVDTAMGKIHQINPENFEVVSFCYVWLWVWKCFPVSCVYANFQYPRDTKFLSVTPTIFFLSLRHGSVLSSGGSRISPREASIPGGGVLKPINFKKVCQNLHENEKMKKNWDQEGVRVPGAPSLDPTLLRHISPTPSDV